MRLASSFSTIDPVRGFKLMATAIKAANAVSGLDDLRTEPRLLHLKGASRIALQVGECKADFRAGFRARGFAPHHLAGRNFPEPPP